MSLVSAFALLHPFFHVEELHKVGVERALVV